MNSKQSKFSNIKTVLREWMYSIDSSPLDTMAHEVILLKQLVKDLQLEVITLKLDLNDLKADVNNLRQP
ncbi:MAG: hypothetical protein AAF542_21045 [Pseudomonadota bacterium]